MPKELKLVCQKTLPGAALPPVAGQARSLRKAVFTPSAGTQSFRCMGCTLNASNLSPVAGCLACGNHGGRYERKFSPELQLLQR
jgi:hypothetical protein